MVQETLEEGECVRYIVRFAVRGKQECTDTRCMGVVFGCGVEFEKVEDGQCSQEEGCSPERGVIVGEEKCEWDA